MAAVDYFNHDPVVHTWTYKFDKAAWMQSGNFGSMDFKLAGLSPVSRIQARQYS